GPVVIWQPGAPPPNFGSVAWLLQRRWVAGPRTTTVFVATRQTAQLYGGRGVGRLRQRLQATHDLGVTAMYLQRRKTAPEEAAQWISEDRLAAVRRRQKIPDAVLATSPL